MAKMPSPYDLGVTLAPKDDEAAQSLIEDIVGVLKWQEELLVPLSAEMSASVVAEVERAARAAGWEVIRDERGITIRRPKPKV